MRVSAGFDPTTGARRQISRTVAGGRREAERELTRLLRQVDSGLSVDPGHLSFAAYLTELYIPSVDTGLSPKTGKPYAPTTRDRYRWSIENYLVPALGRTPLRELRPLAIERFRDELRAAGNLSAGTINDVMRVLNAALRQACRWGMLEQNPAEWVTKPTPEREAERERFTADTAHRVLQAARASNIEVGVHLALGASLRREEVLGLRWSDVDFTLQQIFVRQSVTYPRRSGGGGREIFFGPTKTAKSNRGNPVPDFVIASLERQRLDQETRRLLLGDDWHALDLVVDRGDGRPWIPTSFSRRWRVLAECQGIEWVTFRTLRLGYNSMLRALGADGKLRAELMGHTRVQTGDDYYIDIDPAESLAAVKRLDTLFEVSARSNGQL